MEMNDYQKKAIVTDVVLFERKEKIKTERNVIAPGFLEKILGLPGEAGEVADKFKKIIRDNKGVISDEDCEKIVMELGDVLWYIALIAEYLDVPLEEVAEKNIEKLHGRLKRGTLHGAGDNR